MCGISGIIYKNNSITDRNEIKRMNDMIIHRGPDGEGYYFGGNFALGHRRLSIIDLTDGGKQPMNFEDKYIIVYNGEIYNYKDLKEELSQYGYQYKSYTDTEVILSAYDKWGTECVNHFNGMWSFAIYDFEKGIIFCSRDRFGVKPFYYTEIDNRFIFGSEIKQFTALNGWKAKGNRKRIIDFLMFEMFDHTNETLFEGVYQLRGGHSLIYDLRSHTFSTYRYYTIDTNDENNISFEDICSDFYSIFEDSIKLRLQADVKLGSCLSGGLDSSSIVCIINRILKTIGDSDRQETVSSCFNYKKYDEQKYIDEVVKLTDVVSHKVFPNLEDLFHSLDDITWHQDEPFGSTSIFAQWSVFKTAKANGITVMLDGQGADEQLAGYDGFYGVFLSELLRKYKFATVYNEIKSLKKLNKYPYTSIIKSMAKFMVPNSLKALIKNHMKIGVFNWVKTDNEYYIEYLNNLYGSNIKTIREYSINQLLYSSLPKLLHYEDRDSMAHSIESRVPFLDYRLVEFVLGTSSEYKIHDGITKYMLRNAMSGILPDKVRDRKDKMGFVTPEEIWIRENKEEFKKMVLDSCDFLAPIINKECVSKWYDDLIDSDSKIDFTIWRLVSLGTWVKVFNVSI